MMEDTKGEKKEGKHRERERERERERSLIKRLLTGDIIIFRIHTAIVINEGRAVPAINRSLNGDRIIFHIHTATIVINTHRERSP